MGRKKKAAKSWAEKARKMNEVLKSRKLQIEKQTTMDCRSSVSINQPQQDRCDRLSQKNSSVNETNESTKLVQQDFISTETTDTVLSIDDKNQDDINCFQLNISSTPVEPSIPSIEGRRIINITYFFTKLKEIANHGNINCGLGCVEIVGERHVGLFSKFTLKCKLCNEMFYIESDSPDDLYINHSAVAGIIAIGAGHWQLQELSASLELPLMTPKIYQQSHAKITKDIEKISIDSMNQAAEKERQMAKAEGRVDKDGIPIIDVVVDGCWSKRTYKKNYSALSGAAAIIGKNTGEVLFLGVRNKYCCICARAEKIKIEPETHVCYKNYSGPSTGMESNILLEGFKSSIEMHGLVYGRMVSDGDSNTYAKILKARPYDHLTVEKIECRNHVLRNLCNKLVQLQTDTKYALKFRKQMTQKKIMILRKTIREIIKIYKTDSESERRCNIKPFYDDLLLAHLHAFGDHSRCKISFCTEMNKPSEMISASDKSFFTSTLWSRICLIMSNVASHAPSLIHDVDSNSVERFNSIVAKLSGGKRINLSLRGSYQMRCQAALVSFNTHKLMSSLYKGIQGRSPTGKIKRLEKQRLQKMVNMRKFYRKKNRLLFSKGNDENYGEKCEKPDMPQDIFENKKCTFLQNLNRSDEERDKIQKETILQGACSEWMEIRRTILTASNFGRVVKRRKDVSCANLVKDILYKDSLSHVTSINHGRDNEKKAIEQLKIQENIEIRPCGLFIDEEIPFLGASPDGIVGDNMIVEIKCPITAFKTGINEAIKSGKLPFYKINKNGILQINKTHNWYFQIQGQLHITKIPKCLLGIWYGENEPLKTEIITKDDSFWDNEMENKLKNFYIDCLLPELVDPRHARNLKIRDPEYIEKAIKEKQKNYDIKKGKAVSKIKFKEVDINQEMDKKYAKKRKIDNDENSEKMNQKEAVCQYNNKEVFNKNHECFKDITLGLCNEDQSVLENCNLKEVYPRVAYGRKQLDFTEF